MARCEDIELLLGPFEDGELEPHEMQEVARHTATCSACEGVLADYRTMAVTLRGSQAIPSLDNFASGVMARIQKMHLPTPMPEMKQRHWYDTVSDWFANTIVMGGLAAGVAIITAVVVTPELSWWLHRQAHANPVIAMAGSTSKASLPLASKSANNSPSQPADPGDNDQVATADNNGDAGTEISSIQSDSPSVAVWTAPETKTTVVWVPDQQP